MTEDTGSRLGHIQEAVRRQLDRNSVMQRLDLLAAAWRWSAEDQANALNRSAAELDACRHHDREADDVLVRQAAALEQLQFGLWASVPFGDYADWWRRPWRGDSPIGSRSPFAALVEMDIGLQLLQDHFDAMLSGDFS